MPEITKDSPINLSLATNGKSNVIKDSPVNLKLSNDISGSKNIILPGYNFQDIDRYKRFIDDIYPNVNLDRQAAANQSNWSKFGNMWMQGVLGEILAQGVAGGIGATGELPKAIWDEAHKQDADFTNFLTKFADDISAELGDRFPIFRYNPGKTFDWKDWGWWTESGVSIFSTLGMLIPAMGEAKTASWFSKGLAKVSVAAKVNKMTAAAKGVMVASDIFNTEKHWVGLTHSALAMRNAENMREASGVYHTMLPELTTSLQDEETYQKTLASPVGQEFL